MTDANEWRGRTGDSWAAEWRRTDQVAEEMMTGPDADLED